MCQASVSVSLCNTVTASGSRAGSSLHGLLGTTISMAAEPNTSKSCWLGLVRLLRLGTRHSVQDDDNIEVAAEPSGGCLHYEDRRDAVNEVVLEGGEGDAVYFQRVLPGSRAAKLGVQKGDEVLQVNLIDPEILFWRPAEEILPAIVGPVMLKWRRRPPQKSGERTRINSKPIKLLWHDDEEELQDVIPEYPKSRAETLGEGEWLCGSCGAKNFDTQEHCRRCGLRDSRLPKRPGPQPRRHVDLQRSIPAVSFGRVDIDKQAVKHAASAGRLNVCDV
ncbi:unnamed protein product [Symbiodinium sp. CCMP2592]|nr:unnamed protein product [Symbiodinium sp. CCMP2592]